MTEYPATAAERAMKVQEAILQAMAKNISAGGRGPGNFGSKPAALEAAPGAVCYDGLFDRRRGKLSPKLVPLEQAEQALQLYREKYFDRNVRHFHEKLREVHSIRLSSTRVKLALQGAKLVNRDGSAGA